MSKIILTQLISDADAPAAGKSTIYAKTDGALYQIDSAGTVIQVTSGSPALGDLTDTTITAETSGHFLNWNGTAWVNASYFLQPSGYQVPSGNYAAVEQGHELWQASGVGGSLTNLSDTTIGVEASGHVLSYNGTAWINADSSGGSSTLAALTDTSVPSPTSGMYLAYDGSTWNQVAAPVAGGGFTVTTETSTPYSASASDYILFNLSGTDAVVNLPAAATAGANTRIGVKKIDDGQELVTISGNGGETIDGLSGVNLVSQYDAMTLITDGSNWFITG